MTHQIKNNPRIQSARFCPACGEIHAVPKGERPKWYPLTRRQIDSIPDLLRSLKYAVELIEGLEPGLVGVQTMKDVIAKAEGSK